MDHVPNLHLFDKQSLSFHLIWNHCRIWTRLCHQDWKAVGYCFYSQLLHLLGRLVVHTASLNTVTKIISQEKKCWNQSMLIGLCKSIKLLVKKFLSVEGGEASSWNYGQKLKKYLKHFFAKFEVSTIYRFWDISFQSWEISPTVLPVEIQVCRNWDMLFEFY